MCYIEVWVACVCCPRHVCLSCPVNRMCHHLGSLAHVIALVLIWGTCFFLPYPVCHMVEHRAGVGGFCAFLMHGLWVCDFGIPVSAAACSH